MENASLLSGGISPKQPPTRRHAGNGPGRDVWAAVRNGSVHDVEVALGLLKRTNGNIDSRNAFGSSALHIAAWRNHLPIIRRLLAAGADPNVRDGESGWSSLHRALHFGHLAVAGVLIAAGGSLVLEDSKGRTPVDLTSGPLNQSLDTSSNPGAREVFSWGNGSNYQLGNGITGILGVPGRVDALQGLNVVAVAAAKFHSVALTASGEIYSWGFGRGGRLGHPDFDIHSGQVAVITPRQITNSFGGQSVSVIAVAKHHTVVATTGGGVYTWGSNREGRLGYPSVDTQPTPRRVSTLKARVVAVAAANKHSAVLTEVGEVFTWGCNTEGQLGYGTSNSISNYVPRLVECLQGKKLVAVSTAKYHTIVLGSEGEVLTWGYKMVNPRRISVVRYTKKAGSLPLKFHYSEKLHVVAISAGMTHSLALSEDGLVFYWFSADQQLKCRQLLSMAGHQAVAVSSSKYRTAVVTSTGDVYSWDGENSKADTTVLPRRVPGIKHATQLSVGENHSVVVAALFIPDYPLSSVTGTGLSTQSLSMGDDDAAIDPELEDDVFCGELSSPKNAHTGSTVVLNSPPSLKDLCERVAAQSILEPKSALQVLEFADSLGADFLRKHCEELISRNVDYVLTMAPVLFGHLKSSLLARVEKASSTCSTQLWSRPRLSSPNVTLSAVIDSEDEEDGLGSSASVMRMPRESSVFRSSSDRKMSEGFLQQSTENGESLLKQVRAVRKKLQQIEALELKQAKGLLLDEQQLAKLQTKQELKHLLLLLESGIIPEARTKLHKKDVKSESDVAEQSPSVRKNPKSRAGGSKQARLLEKKKSKGKGSNEALLTGSVGTDFLGMMASDRRDMSTRHPSLSKSLERPMLVGARSDSSSTVNNGGFVKISGFTSHTAKGLEQVVFEDSMSDVSSIAEATVGCPLPTEQSPILRKVSMPVPVQPSSSRKMATLGKKVVKGGLSVFLSGALDDPPKAVVPEPAPVIPKVEGPAWGGAHASTRLTSLRAIQCQQKTEPKLDFTQAVKVGSGSSLTGERSHSSSKQVLSVRQVSSTKATASVKQVDKAQIVVEDTESNNKRVSLSQFVRTSPIAVANNRSSASAHPENSPPPWAASTSSTVALSLRDIQLEQVKSKGHHRPTLSCGSPSLSSPVGASTLLAVASSSEHNLHDTPNRWFKPEVGSPSTLRCIQIEEKAMKELRQMYKNVKLVKNDGS